VSGLCIREQFDISEDGNGIYTQSRRHMCGAVWRATRQLLQGSCLRFAAIDKGTLKPLAFCLIHTFIYFIFTLRPLNRLFAFLCRFSLLSNDYLLITYVSEQ
jgi:hypothetical protein